MPDSNNSLSIPSIFLRKQCSIFSPNIPIFQFPSPRSQLKRKSYSSNLLPRKRLKTNDYSNICDIASSSSDGTLDCSPTRSHFGSHLSDGEEYLESREMQLPSMPCCRRFIKMLALDWVANNAGSDSDSESFCNRESGGENASNDVEYTRVLQRPSRSIEEVDLCD